MINTPENIIGYFKNGIFWDGQGGESESQHIYIRADKYEMAIECLKAIAKPVEHNDAHLSLFVRQTLAERTLKELGEE